MNAPIVSKAGSGCSSCPPTKSGGRARQSVFTALTAAAVLSGVAWLAGLAPAMVQDLPTTCRNLTLVTKDIQPGSVPGTGDKNGRVKIRASIPATTPPASLFDGYLAPIPSGAGVYDYEINSVGETVYVLSGWAYLIGNSPTAKTQKVKAVGVGTKFIVEIDGNTHRVYLLAHGTNPVVHLTTTGALEYKEFRTVDRFVEIDPTGHIGQERPISERQWFIDQVRAESTAALLPW